MKWIARERRAAARFCATAPRPSANRECPGRLQFCHDSAKVTPGFQC